MDSESDIITMTSMASTAPSATGQGASPHRPGGRSRSVTARWQVGRLVRVSLAAGCGFIRVPSGELIYFTMDDVDPAGGELRAGSRVRFQQVASGVPRAVKVFGI